MVKKNLLSLIIISLIISLSHTHANYIDIDSIERELKKLTEDSNDKQEESKKKSNEQNHKNDDISSEMIESIGIGYLRSMPYAEIIVTNKITTKTENVVFKVGEVKFLGNLSIEIHKCINDPNLYDPNNMMLVTVFDSKIEDDRILVFHGWIMSNNLSISTVEHPVWEVFASQCNSSSKSTVSNQQ